MRGWSAGSLRHAMHESVFLVNLYLTMGAYGDVLVITELNTISLLPCGYL